MLLRYTPEGTEGRTWTFTPEKLLSSEAEAIEKATKMTYAEFGVAIIKGSATARRALLWVYLKREEPTLKLASIDVPVGVIALEYEPHELVAMRAEAERSEELTDTERRMALEFFDKEIGDAEVEAPKATGNGDASSDLGSSHTSSISPPLRSAG